MVEKKYTVYAHKNKINGKIYIGITCQPLKNRWSNGKGYRSASHFGKAINKYGWDAFEHCIIVENVSGRVAKEIEENLIDLLCLTNPERGYNEARGGGGGGMYGKHQSEDAKERIREARKRDGFTEEHRKHISDAKKGLKHHFAKPVYQYKKDGSYVKKWAYMSLAAQKLNIQKTAISSCCLGRRPSAGGFVWSYEERT